MAKLASKDDLYELLLRTRVHVTSASVALDVDRALIPYLRERGRVARSNYEHALANGFPVQANNWAMHLAFFRDELLGCLQRVEAGEAANAAAEQLAEARFAKIVQRSAHAEKA
jgi:hypothetical protein